MNISSLSIDFGNTNAFVYVKCQDGTLSALAIPAISVSDVLLSENTTDRVITTIPSEVYLGDGRAFIRKQAFREVDKSHSNAAYSKYAINFKKNLLNVYAADFEERESRQRELLRYGEAYLSTLCMYIKNEIGM